MGPFYLALWGWIRIDDGDLWIRALSALGVVAAVWGIWLVVRRWSGDRAAAVAVVVFVLTPFVLKWSMQARGYGMAMAFTAWSMVFADRMIQRKGRWPSVLFGVMVGLTVATQISTMFVFMGVVVALWILAPTWETVRSLALAGLAAFVAFAPFSVALLLNPGQPAWIPPLTLSFFTNQMTSLASGPLWACLIGSGWLCLIAASVRTAKFSPYLVALAGSVSGIVGLAMFSAWFSPLFIDRYLIGCLPLAVIAAVGGWSAVWPRRWPIMAVAVVAMSALIFGGSIEKTRPYREDYRAASDLVTSSMRPGDSIVAIGGWPIGGLVRYLPDGTPTEKLLPSTDAPGSWVIRSKDGSDLQADRIWILYRNIWPTPDQAEWIKRNYPVVVSSHRLDGIQLELRETASGR